MLSSVLWIIIFALAIFSSLYAIEAIILDRDFPTESAAGTFVAPSILWAIIIVFFFN